MRFLIRRFQLALTAAAVLMTTLPLLAQVVTPNEPAPDCPPQVCMNVPADPSATGALGRTNEPYPNFFFDHPFIHSGTHLQGVGAKVKWAGGLIHRPPAGASNFDRMTGAVIVDNPDPILPMTVQIDYFDSVGTNVGQTVTTIQPEGHYMEPATPLAASFGTGTARVTVLDGPYMVGATLQHTTVFRVPVGGTTVSLVDGDNTPLSTNGQPPGASSMQQLQKVQGHSSRLRWHFPLSIASPVDFLNANLPWYHVVNPNNAPNLINVNLTVFDRTNGTVTGPILWRSLTLPANGSLTDVSGPHLGALGTQTLGLFEALVGTLVSTPGIDWDVLIDVQSASGLPLLGDGYMADLVATNNAIRMASTMMSSTPQAILLSPEFSYDRPGAGGIQQTLIGVFNVGANDAGPVTIQYFDNNGALLSTFTVPSLPANQSLRIQPGALGYPTTPATSGFGWARITACQGELIGWTVREALPSTSVNQQYHKAYGETLLELNGIEPGQGIFVPVLGVTRKVSPFAVAATPVFPWPGYMMFGNFQTSNIGFYNWQLFNANGLNCGFTAFAGLPFGATSWTYEDILNTCGGPLTLTGRVDHALSEVEGIDVIGDPLDELRNFSTFNLNDFALPPESQDDPRPF